jgi:hypothetical protein
MGVLVDTVELAQVFLKSFWVFSRRLAFYGISGRHCGISAGISQIILGFSQAL